MLTSLFGSANFPAYSLLKSAKLILPNFNEVKDVVSIDRELIGKYIFTTFDNTIAGGIITEIYNAVVDRASHAFGRRRTARREIMYREAGT